MKVCNNTYYVALDDPYQQITRLQKLETLLWLQRIIKLTRNPSVYGQSYNSLVPYNQYFIRTVESAGRIPHESCLANITVHYYSAISKPINVTTSAYLLQS